MKKIIILVLVLVSLIITSLFVINKFYKKNQSDQDDITYEILDYVDENVKFNKEIKGEELIHYNNEYYLFIKMGALPTGGYSIKVKDININEDKVIINVQTISPGPHEMVTQAFTYPYVCIKFNKKANYEVEYNDLKEE